MKSHFVVADNEDSKGRKCVDSFSYKLVNEIDHRKKILYEMPIRSVFEVVVSNNAISLTLITFYSFLLRQNGYIHELLGMNLAS